MPAQTLIRLDDRSQVGEARRAVAEFTRTLSFNSSEASNVAIAVTEAATNIVKHATRGRILLRPVERQGVGGVEVLAVDQGPGISNISASMRDGHSTAGSLGAGLGALRRSTRDMQIFTQPGKGTAIWLRYWARPIPTEGSLPPVEVGAVCLAKSGEVVSGDDWLFESARGSHAILVADGLGHGPDAAQAARAAATVLAKHPASKPGELLELGHGALAATRGAAVAVARFDFDSGQGVFAGIGNIAARIESAGNRRQLVSHNGTLGHAVRKIQEFPFELPQGGVLILHSDGMSANWMLADYPGLMAKHPALIAGVLYRDHDRGRDDVTVVAIKNGAGA
ncbi:MAG TPA: ATP-binding protein [Steroidobacteraceae bacterium]